MRQEDGRNKTILASLNDDTESEELEREHEESQLGREGGWRSSERC